jgi:hypothetical protein
MIPMIKKKRADVMNAVMDQSAIGAAATPQADRKMVAPSLSGAQKLPPMSAPMAPRQSMGGPAPQEQAPRNPMMPNMGGRDPIADAAKNRMRRGSERPSEGAQYTGGKKDFTDMRDQQVEAAYNDGTGNKPSAGSSAGSAESEQDKIDREIRDFVRSRIGAASNVDTAEAEALITRQMEGKLGEGLVDARARGGRAGFGMSGAQMAVEGDVRGAASRSALDQILGLRRGEEQRAIENATSAISTEQGMRSAASADALRRMVLESLQAEAGLGGDEGGIPDAINGGVDAALGAVGAETEKPSLATSNGKTAPSIENGMDPASAIPVSSPPSGSAKTSVPGVWYSAATRKYYKVQ